MKNKFRDTEKATGIGTGVLVPVDFSPKDTLALQVGFALAARFGLGVKILHASPVPTQGLFPQFPDQYNGLDNTEGLLEEVELEGEISDIDREGIRKIRRAVDAGIKNGNLPNIRYDAFSAPGMPEEVIGTYCELKHPAAVVMATRSIAKRREELIGSVTAEVIDSCRVPVFTIPENYHFDGFKEIRRLVAFCYLEGGDARGIETLMSMFGNPEVKIYLFPATDKGSPAAIDSKMESLYDELRTSYPNVEFEKVPADGSDLKKVALKMFDTDHIQMIVAPNRKRNAFARFFHPGLPHRILFEKDIPMLAIPV